MKSKKSHRWLFGSTVFVIGWGLMLEFPIRYWLSPDPWIHSSDHWYFNQPSRLFLELGFIVLALFPFFWVAELKRSLVFKWSKKNLSFLIYGMLGSVFIFSLQQWEEIQIILDQNLAGYIVPWFITGFMVGVGQELTFRGLLYSGLQKKFGISWAAAISTLLFVAGSIHSVRLYNYFTHGYLFETSLLIGIFALAGLLFVWIRIKTNSAIIPGLIHGVGNAITWATFVVVKLYA